MAPSCSALCSKKKESLKRPSYTNLCQKMYHVEENTFVGLRTVQSMFLILLRWCKWRLGA